MLHDLLGVGHSAIRCGITFVWKNLHGVVVIFQCVHNEWCGVSGRPVRRHVRRGAMYNEAVVDINSAEVVTLGSFPDKVGLFGRRKDAAVSWILQGRDSRSVRFLVPDARGLDQNFHDVTIVDMDDEREPMVTQADMTRLRELWPPEIFNHMRWFQQDLKLMRKSAKGSSHSCDRCHANSVGK